MSKHKKSAVPAVLIVCRDGTIMASTISSTSSFQAAWGQEPRTYCWKAGNEERKKRMDAEQYSMYNDQKEVFDDI